MLPLQFIKKIMPKGWHPASLLTQLVLEKTGGLVCAGPFKGLRYVDKSIGSTYIPKLLGIYEKELHAVIYEIIERKPQSIIDIGAAEGYYAIGLAKVIPEVEVVAFESEVDGQRLVKEMAGLNGVEERISIEGFCSREALSSKLESLKSTPVVICDVEGAEFDLICPDDIGELLKCIVLVENHDFVNPVISQSLKERFESSHNIVVIDSEERPACLFPFSSFVTKILPKRFIMDAVSEHRPCKMTWYYMVPKDLT